MIRVFVGGQHHHMWQQMKYNTEKYAQQSVFVRLCVHVCMCACMCLRGCVCRLRKH